jgi:hypothetical protein
MKVSMNAVKRGSLCVLALVTVGVPGWAAGPASGVSQQASAVTSGLLPRVFDGSATADSTPAGSTLRNADASLRQLVASAPALDATTAFAQLSTLAPGASFQSSTPYALPLVKIDPVADGADVDALKSALESLVLQTTSTFSNAIAGWLPVSQIEATAALPQLRQVKAPWFFRLTHISL